MHAGAKLALVLTGLLVAGLPAIRQPDMPLAELKARYANHASVFAEIGGMPVHYRDEGSGPPLLLLHGTASSLHTWDGWAEALGSDFRILRMDLPGFGLTGPSPERDYTIDAYVAWLDTFVSRLGLDSFHIAGNSLGGHIAWRYALAHPERVERLVLVDAAGYPRTTPQPPPFAIRLARVPVVNRVLTFAAPKGLYRQSVLDVYGDPARVTGPLVQRYFELSLRPGNRQAFVDRARTDRAVAGDDPGRVSQPTLVIWGSEDRWIDVADGEAFARDIPDARLVVFDGAGHVPMEEIPRPSAAVVREFLLN